MGLLDRVMDMVFLLNTRSVGVRSSQRRFLFLRVLAQTKTYLVIDGPYFLKTNDIWHDVVTLHQLFIIPKS